MITFLYHIRIDTKERAKNLALNSNYYKKMFPDSEFIVVEDNSKPTITPNKDYKVLFFKNEGPHQKCTGYNIGANAATNNILCFVDADTLVSKENMNESLLQLEKISNSIIIGYNGTAIYFNYNVKNQLNETNLTYDFLNSFVEQDKIYTWYRNNDYLITNTKAVGGCLLMTKKTFKDINGFNPNFKGWGYEDNEIISRARILGYPIYAINTDKPYLFHLPHEEVERDKSKHGYYSFNEQLIRKIEAMDKSQLQEYIKTW